MCHHRKGDIVREIKKRKWKMSNGEWGMENGAVIQTL